MFSDLWTSLFFVVRAVLVVLEVVELVQSGAVVVDAVVVVVEVVAVDVGNYASWSGILFSL